MKTFAMLGLLSATMAAAGFAARPASAGLIVASGVHSAVLDADGINYDFTILLTNSLTSADPIGTFWFSWVPGKDFMVNNPISITSPSGWTGIVTHIPNVPTNGYAIQWVASSPANYLAIGNSLTFAFKSAETPALLGGNSPLFPDTPEGLSFVYNARPFSADSLQFVVTQAPPVPEPATAAIMFTGGLLLLGYRRLKGRKHTDPAIVS